MSIWKKLFGRKKEPPIPPAPVRSASQPAPVADPSKDPNLIRVFDSYGRELFITRQEWRDSVLLGNLKKAWDQPDQLYGMIVGALNDGFLSDVVDAAKQLYKIDPTPSRGACIWGIVLMEEGRLDEAEKVFRNHNSRHGEDGVILTNLAKVYAKRKDDAKAGEILWRALQLDPNQENGMGWYEVIHRERGGDAASGEALRRVAALPGSWRAQLWLARAALKSRELDKAVLLYRESLSRAPHPVPADLLMQISGDLGNSGHLPEILELVEPQFDATTHGLQVGNNLIKAHLDLGQLDAARRIVDQLYAQKRPDWRESLNFWDTEIAKAGVAATTVSPKAQVQMAMLTIEGPVWLKPTSPAAELFPAHSSDAPVIAFLGSSAEMATNVKSAQHQMPDAPGRLSRALPLFLAEQVELGSDARARTLIPWIVEPSAGFVLCGVAWNDEDAANYARQDGIKGDFVVVTHLKTQAEPWIAELRLVRTIDGRCLETLSATFPSTRFEDGIPALARQLLQSLARHAEVEQRTASPLYQVPLASQFPYYLLRMEQLLAVRCGSMDGVKLGFLHGEREVVDGNLQLSLACPDNVPARLLLAQTLMALKAARPAVVAEFKDRVMLLQKERPLHEPAHAVVQRLFNDAFAA